MKPRLRRRAVDDTALADRLARVQDDVDAIRAELDRRRPPTPTPMPFSHSLGGRL